MTRLVGLAEDYLGSGAAGLSFGFLDADLEVDVETCAYLVGLLPARRRGPSAGPSTTPSTCAAPGAVWSGCPALPRCARPGSPRGLEAGYDELLAVAADPAVARMLMPGGGLLAEQVPWFARVGVRQFHLGRQARPGASYKAYVDTAHVRSWRLLARRRARAGRPLRGVTSAR